MTQMRSDILYGIAVADAIGNPLEFLSQVNPSDFKKSKNTRVLRVSDDTQMSMFLYEALVTKELSVLGSANEVFKGAYLRWYQTQSYRSRDSVVDGLLRFDSLYHVEAPGSTCMSACRSLSSGLTVTNDSKGNGTVMRCAPIAMVGQVFDWSLPNQVALARLDALTTHKHPFAGDSSAFLVTLYHFLLRGVSFHEALGHAEDELRGIINPHVMSLVLGMLNVKTFRSQMKTMGGWIAEEALAMAVGSVFHSASYEEAISKAICIGGDSDTVGGIAGGLAVAAGLPVPSGLIPKLNVLDAMEYLFKE